MQIVGEHWPTLGKIEPGPMVTAILNQNPDALYVSLFGSDWLAFVREAQKRGPVPEDVRGRHPARRARVHRSARARGAGGHARDRLSLVRRRHAGAQGVRRGFQKKTDKTPVLGSLVGYVTYLSIFEAIRKAGGTDTEKLVAAFKGLKVETPIGPISFRAADGQSTMGAWVGTTKLDAKRGVGVMVNHEYIPGEKVLPSEDEVEEAADRQLAPCGRAGPAILSSLVLVQLLSGLAHAMVLFLIASGLTLIFGVTRVVNFAHGSFYMLAAYITYTLAAACRWAPPPFMSPSRPPPWPWRCVGSIVEVLLLRRVYRAPGALPAAAHLRARARGLRRGRVSSGAPRTRRDRSRRVWPARWASPASSFPPTTSR